MSNDPVNNKYRSPVDQFFKPPFGGSDKNTNNQQTLNASNVQDGLGPSVLARKKPSLIQQFSSSALKNLGQIGKIFQPEGVKDRPSSPHEWRD
jgi:hypothetical protein